MQEEIQNKKTTMFQGATPITFENAKRLRGQMTLAEKTLWNRLSRKQLNNYRFKSQHPVANFIADFYCHRARLIIEVDGGVHDHPEQAAYDNERTTDLETLGIKVLRFTNDQVIHETEKVIEKIKETLNEKLSPLGELEGL